MSPNYDVIHVYRVEPQRNTQTPTAPEGGALKSTGLATHLAETFDKIGLQKANEIVFRMQGSSGRGNNSVRDLMMQFAFDSSKRSQASAALATRLSEEMDKRTKPCLFIMAADLSSNLRQVTTWTFPEDEAYQFSVANKTPKVKLLTDLFSHNSPYRKAVHFEGRNDQYGFLTGRMLDRENARQGLPVADYWLEDVLDCKLTLTPPLASKQVVATLKKTNDQAETVEEKAAIMSVAGTVASATAQDWSANKIASLLPAKAGKKFLDNWTSKVEPDTAFQVSGESIKAQFQFIHYDLHNGLIVTATANDPHGLTVTEYDEEQEDHGSKHFLSCEGWVVNQRGSNKRS